MRMLTGILSLYWSRNQEDLSFPSGSPNPCVSFQWKPAAKFLGKPEEWECIIFEDLYKGSHFSLLFFSINWLTLESRLCFHYNTWQSLKRKESEERERTQRLSHGWIHLRNGFYDILLQAIFLSSELGFSFWFCFGFLFFLRFIYLF